MVRSCLSPTLKARVALTLMYGTAKRFEAWQNSFIFNWYTDSGFSAEDLVSDLIGFYRVFGTGPDPLLLAKPLSYTKALQIWDTYGAPGNFKILSLRHSYLQPILLLKKSTNKKEASRMVKLYKAIR